MYFRAWHFPIIEPTPKQVAWQNTKFKDAFICTMGYVTSKTFEEFLLWNERGKNHPSWSTLLNLLVSFPSVASEHNWVHASCFISGFIFQASNLSCRAQFTLECLFDVIPCPLACIVFLTTSLSPDPTPHPHHHHHHKCLVNISEHTSRF